MQFVFEFGTFDWCWYPHFWVYRPNSSSQGAIGFRWLGLLIRVDFSSELASRSVIERGLFGGDVLKQNRPTFEVDWRKKA